MHFAAQMQLGSLWETTALANVTQTVGPNMDYGEWEFDVPP